MTQANSNRTQIELVNVPDVLYKSSIVLIRGYHKTALCQIDLTTAFYEQHFTPDRVHKLKRCKTFYNQDVLTVLKGLNFTQHHVDKINSIQNTYLIT